MLKKGEHRIKWLHPQKLKHGVREQCGELSVKHCVRTAMNRDQQDLKVHGTIKMGSTKTKGKWNSTLSRSTSKPPLCSPQTSHRLRSILLCQPADLLGVTLRHRGPDLSCTVSLPAHDSPLKFSRA